MERILPHERTHTDRDSDPGADGVSYAQGEEKGDAANDRQKAGAGRRSRFDELPRRACSKHNSGKAASTAGLVYNETSAALLSAPASLVSCLTWLQCETWRARAARSRDALIPRSILVSVLLRPRTRSRGRQQSLVRQSIGRLFTLTNFPSLSFLS